MGEWHAVWHLRHSSDKLRSGRSVELSVRLRLNDPERQSLQLTHETLNLLCRAVGPGQRQVGRNRPAICNTNSLSEQVMPAGGDDVWILPRGWKGNGRAALYVQWENLSDSMPLTLKELPAASSGSGSRQGQPHDGVGPLLHTAQPLAHHVVELRHWLRNS